MKNKSGNYFMLFSCCLITKGFNRSIIIDTQRSSFHFIPNELTDLIEQFGLKTLDEITQQFNESAEMDIFSDYLNFLVENELGFYTSTPSAFPAIATNFLSPNMINNAILDFRKNIKYEVDNRLKELEALGCEAVQIRIYENLDPTVFKKLTQIIERLSFRFVELLLNADTTYQKKDMSKLLRANPNINKIVLYKSQRDDLISLNYYQVLELRAATLISRDQCGQMGAKYFTTSINHVIESHNFNSCLNKKISIDEDGFIKNCPSLNQNFGNAEETSLIEALEKKGFKAIWTTGKEKIEVCKDCEFRHICTDCRAYVQNPTIDFSKPIKCGYDPYSSTWEDWSINVLKKDIFNGISSS